MIDYTAVALVRHLYGLSELSSVLIPGPDRPSPIQRCGPLGHAPNLRSEDKAGFGRFRLDRGATPDLQSPMVSNCLPPRGGGGTNNQLRELFLRLANTLGLRFCALRASSHSDLLMQQRRPQGNPRGRLVRQAIKREESMEKKPRPGLGSPLRANLCVSKL